MAREPAFPEKEKPLKQDSPRGAAERGTGVWELETRARAREWGGGRRGVRRRLEARRKKKTGVFRGAHEAGDAGAGRPTARPHLQVDGALQREGLGLLDVLVAELVDPPGPSGLRAIGWHHRHAAVLGHWRRTEVKEAGRLSRGPQSYLRPPQQTQTAVNVRPLEEAYAHRKCLRSLWRQEVGRR